MVGERDVKRVHEDAQVLVELGLVERNENGSLHCPYADIHVDMHIMPETQEAAQTMTSQKNVPGGSAYPDKAKILTGVAHGERAIQDGCVVSHTEAKQALSKYLPSKAASATASSSDQ